MKTVTEVSKELNISIQQVRKYIKSGKLKANKKLVGLQKYIYEISDIQLNEFKKSIEK